LTRFIFPEDRIAFVYQGPGDPILTPDADPVVVYEDEAGTILADIQELDSTPIPSSTLTIGADALIPRFLGPDDVDTLYAKAGSGPTYPMFAELDQRLDLIEQALFDAGTEVLIGPKLPAPSVPD